MKNLFIIAAFLTLGTIQAQTKRDIGSFTKLSVAGAFDVKLNANASQISIDSKDQDLASNVVTEVVDGTLKIHMKEGYRVKKWAEVNIEVPFKTLDEISLVGSGDIAALQPIVSENFSLSLTGSGDITLELNNTNTQAKLTGSGDIKLKGKTTNFQADVSGSGDLTAEGLKAENTKVQVSGSGDAQVYASAALMARVAGSGDIKFAGNPPSEDSKVSGSGSINKI